MSIDSEKIARIRAGDAKAFEELFYDTVGQLVDFACHFLNDRQMAENVVQDTFIKLWEIRESLDKDQNLNSYLYVMVKNKSLNELRKDGIIFNDELMNTQIDSYNPTPEDILDEMEVEEQIKSAIEKLPERCRLIFKMNRFEKKTYAEIANLLDISVKTVENHMVKALKILRVQLHHYLTSILLKY